MPRPFLLTLLLVLTVLPVRTAAQKLIELSATPVTSGQEAMLKRLVSEPSPGHFDAARRLTEKPSAPLVQRLIALTRADKAEDRARAALVLGRIPATPALAATLELALGDPVAAVRESAVSLLVAPGIPALLLEAKLEKRATPGLEDDDPKVRFYFALMLARMGDEAAIPLLKKSLKDHDHHRREEAAEALAELGNPAGVSILINMIRYTDLDHPLLKANRELEGTEAWKNLLASVNDERIRVCGHLERLKAKKALSALKKLAKAKEPRVVRASEKAVAVITGS